MNEFVRVKHPLFGHFSTRSPELWGGEVTEDPAVDGNGKPMLAKPRLNVKAPKTPPARSEAALDVKVD